MTTIVIPIAKYIVSVQIVRFKYENSYVIPKKFLKHL